MELTAILVKTTTPESGTTQNGKSWQKITAVFETVDRFPKSVAVEFRTEGLIAQVQNCQKGMLHRIQLDASSREYEGRYYTELQGWKIEPYSASIKTETPHAAPQPAAPAPATAAPDFDNPLPPLN